MGQGQRTENSHLISARLQRHWTQTEACEHVGVADVRTWQRWESGETTPSMYYRKKLCKVFDLSFDVLFPKHVEVSPLVVNAKQESTSSPDTDFMTIAAMALVLHLHNHQEDLGELMLRVQQVLEEKISGMQKDQSILRREALRFLAHVPLAIYGAIHTPSSLTPDEVLPLYMAALPACWRLYYESGQQELESTLPNYLAQLTVLAETPSKYQKAAAGLLSQCYQLKALLVQGHENFGEALEYCKQAFVYGQRAEDVNLQAMALIRKQDTLYENKRYSQWFTTLKEAETFIGSITPLLSGRIYARLAFVAAYQASAQEVDRYIGLAEDTFPFNPETDTSFLYSHSTRYILHSNKALAYIQLKKVKEAWTALEAASKFIPGANNPRRMDLLIYQIQAAAAMKDLDLSCRLFETLVECLVQFGCELDIGNTDDTYYQLVAVWPHEKRVQQLQRYLHA